MYDKELRKSWNKKFKTKTVRDRYLDFVRNELKGIADWVVILPIDGDDYELFVTCKIPVSIDYWDKTITDLMS